MRNLKNVIDKNFVQQQNTITQNIKSNLNSNYTIEQPLIMLNPYKVSPLTALIAFNTNESGYCAVKVYGKDNTSHICCTFDVNTVTHKLPIYGLYPDCDNKVVVKFSVAPITASFDDVAGTTFEYTIKTDALPEDMHPIDVITKTNSTELTFVTDNYTRAFDCNGDVRWYLTNDLVVTKNSPIRFLKNGNIAVMNNKLLHHHCFVSGFLELNFLGQIANEYIVNGVNHELLELNNGDFLVICDKDDVTIEDYIVIIDRQTGVIKNDYNFKEILAIVPQADPTYQSSQYAYKTLLNSHVPDRQLIAEVRLKYIKDWLHINSVYFNEDENYIIVSCRIKDCVVKLDATTKEICWIFTDDSIDWCDDLQHKILKPTNFTDYCYGQHSAKITPTGELIIFDNGNFKSKSFETATLPNDNYSRAVAFTVDEENLTITRTFSYGEELDEKMFSCYLGNIEYLQPNHYLINFGGMIFDEEGNNYESPIVMCDESIRLKTVICEVADNIEVGQYLINNVNTYRATRNDIYSNCSFSLDQNANVIGKAKDTQTIDINVTIDEMEKAQPLNFTVNKITDLGERLVFDISFDNSCDDMYLVFTNHDKTNTLTFEIKPDGTVGVNKCTLDCLGDDYNVGLFCLDIDNLFGWIN